MSGKHAAAFLLLHCLTTDPPFLFPDDNPTDLTEHINIYALFNTTRVIGALNYTIIGDQLDRHGFISTRLMNPMLPLRPLANPDLVLQLASVEVLYKRSPSSASRAWMSKKPSLAMKPGEILYFEVSEKTQLLTKQ